jgi:aerobic-type carbon monoxide dehydrogenase small subunit (CoxS/CutS family)
MSTIRELIVNGAHRPLDVPDDLPLLDVLREFLGLTGCKIACGEGACGACTVLVADRPVRACITPVAAAVGVPVRTIEGLEQDGRLHPLQQAFLDAGAFQCGYCTPGMIMAALGLLEQQPDADEAAMIGALQGNLCRCGTYPRILQAVRQAATTLQEMQPGGGR